MAKTKKTDTPKRKVAKTKRPRGITMFQTYERVLYTQPRSGERIPAIVTGGPYLYTPEIDGVKKEYYRYDIILNGDTNWRYANEEELLEPPAPRFKRGDIVKLHNGTKDTEYNGIVVRVTPKKDIGYRCDVFWNAAGVVQNFEESSLEIDESEEP